MVRFAAPRDWSLAGQLLALQLAVVVLLLAGGVTAAFLQARADSEEVAAEQTRAAARTIAVTPGVVDALGGDAPSRRLQPLAERMRRATGTDFVVIMSPAGIRYSHPDPARIGDRFIGTIAPAAAGRELTETYTGTLGPSVRSVVPVFEPGTREVIGLVAVGVTTQRVGARLAGQLPLMAGVAAGVLALGATGTWLVTRRVRRQTHGLAPQELRGMYEYHDAVLHSVREGLLVINPDGRLHLINDAAQRLLGLSPGDTGRHVSELELPSTLVGALEDGNVREDELHLTRDRVLVLNQTRARFEGRDLGAVATLRDRTELEALTGELDSVRSVTEALRSQQHEAMNRMHTMVSLIELGHPDQALSFATEELELAQRLTDQLVASVEEPALAALLLGKAAQASEAGVELVVEEPARLPAGLVPQRDLVTIVGNLIDNAIDATVARSGRQRRPLVRVAIGSDKREVRLSVADSGDGPPTNAARMFERGWSTKDTGRGLGLALVAQSVRRLGGRIEVRRSGGAVFDVTLPVDR